MKMVLDNLPAQAFAVACGLVTLIASLMWIKVGKQKDEEQEFYEREEREVADQTEPNHNVQRKLMLINHGARDHYNCCKLVVNKHFDLDKTIFSTLKSPVKRFVMKLQLGNEPYWSETVYKQIEKSWEIVPRAPDINKPILDFMIDDCDFKCEHADGSFMDHLHFCFAYSAQNYKKVSPRVAFLHSIMGVGTNIFPMGEDKIPKLKSLITKEEFVHVEAFPSTLRLLLTGEFLAELDKGLSQGQEVESVGLHRLMGNEPISLTGEELIAQFNFHLMHTLDFLPATNWNDCLQRNFPVFQMLITLHSFMKRHGWIQCKINLNLSDKTGETLGSLLVRGALNPIFRSLAAKGIKNYSTQIGHSLAYSINFMPKI